MYTSYNGLLSALCSCVVAFTNLLLTEQTFIATNGLFHDFQPVVYAIILSQVCWSCFDNMFFVVV